MPYVPDPEIEADYQFVVTIPGYGRPERQAPELLKLVERHVKLSISSRATVTAVVPTPAKKVAKKTTKKATKKPETAAQKRARTTRR